MVYPGDTVVVSKVAVVYVLGDVLKPGGYPINTNNSKMTALQAIALAGYANHTAAVGKSRLVRETADGVQEIELPVGAMQKGKKPDVALLPDDVVYVPFSFVRNLGSEWPGDSGFRYFRGYIHPLMDSILLPHRESVLATAQPFGQITVRDDRRRMERPAAESASIWSRASTWGLLLPLLYFALDGVSPFVNAPTAMRAVGTSSEGGVLGERLGKLCMFVLCMIFVAQRHQAVRRLSMQMKLVTSFPMIALLLFPVSQLATPDHQLRRLASGRHSAHVLHHVPLYLR